MRLGACGIACGVCSLYEKGLCEGCCSGIDEDIERTIEWMRKEIGGCSILECAHKNKTDYCLRCRNFPCELHYEKGPYKRNFLDVLKGYFEKLGS